MRRSRWLSLLGALVATGCLAAFVPGCAADGDRDGQELDGELAGGEASASADALTARQVTAYAPIAPPEHRVTTASLSARLGAPIAAGQKLAVIRS